MAPPSSWLTFGTTVVGPVSIDAQVRTTAKRSPTLTAVRSVFHQQRIGSSATWPARGASRGRGRRGRAAPSRPGLRPRAAGAGLRRSRRLRRRVTAGRASAPRAAPPTERCVRQSDRHFVFRSRRSAVNSTSAVSISHRSSPTRTTSMSGVARVALDLVLPLVTRAGRAVAISRRENTPRAPGLHVVGLDPAVRHARHLVGEPHVGHQQEDVVHGIHQRQLVDDAAWRRRTGSPRSPAPAPSAAGAPRWRSTTSRGPLGVSVACRF